MEVGFADASYDRLETDRSYSHGLPASVVSLYRMCLQLLRAAIDDADLRNLGILDLKSGPTNPHAAWSFQLGKGYELIFEVGSDSRKPTARVLRVEGTSTGGRYER
jgi:plasmid maintenance system killer protein